MKNIIYGLGKYFFKNMCMWTHILKDTIAFCDSDEAVREKYKEIIGLPVIAPKDIACALEKTGGGVGVHNA